MNLVEEIAKLKREKRALILAHNYQRPEVQDVADYVGDSIELSRKASEEKDAEIIVFAAVDFMAESAAILNPEKKILLPVLGARCPMAQMLTVEEIGTARSRHPGVPLVLYVNTSAAAKARADVCCTSANADKVVAGMTTDTVLFGPDRNLAEYVERKTGKTVIPVPDRGFCPTHLLFQVEDVTILKSQHPEARVIAHPECTREIREVADFVGSTSQMCRYVGGSADHTFIVASEEGILHRLRKENPRKIFLAAYDQAICPNMKLNTLERVYSSLKEEKHIVTVPEHVAVKARKALERMFEISRK